MKKFWWGAAFCTLILVTLLALDSNFSSRIRELFYTLQDSLIAALDAARLADPFIFWSTLGAMVLIAVLVALVSIFIAGSKKRKYIAIGFFIVLAGQALVGLLGMILTSLAPRCPC